jgi:flagellar motor switch protein FliM
VTEHILEQQEIDQLLQAVREGKLPTSKDSLVPLLDAAPMDFSVPGWSQDRIIRRPLPVLDLVFERLCPLIQITLTNTLHFPIRA